MRKKRPIHHYLFSHEGNDHRPHLLSGPSVVVLALVIVGVFGLTIFEGGLIGSNANLAAVYSDTLVGLANQDRVTSGLPVLQVSPMLTAAAQAKANDMVTKGYFAHYSPTGVSPWYWITEAGYNFVYAGENLAIDFTDSDAVNAAWLASPEHRANILNIHYTQIGIATAEGVYQGQETTFVVQMFGTPVANVPILAANAPISHSVPSLATAPASPKVPNVVPIAGTVATPATVPIAVRNTSESVVPPASTSPASVLGAATAGTGAAGPADTTPAPTISPIDQVATNPGALAGFIYLVLGLIILIPIFSIIISGVRAHNIKHLAYGTGLIALTVVLFIVIAHGAATAVIL